MTDFANAWHSRYGSVVVDEPAIDPNFLNHRSVRHYSDQPVPESLVEQLVAAAQSASTSSNLQLWSVISVQNADARSAVAKVASDQQQVHKAPWFFVFIADHFRLRQAAQRVGETGEGLDFTEFMLMATIDVALASERMVCAAEAAGLGTCYIGAVRNDVDEIQRLLNLPIGVVPLFGLCLGYPDPAHPAEIKPRLSQSSVWFREQYDPAFGTGDYDERMQAFYEVQHMKGDVTWSMRSSRRVNGQNLEGRERLKSFLTEMGLGRR